MSSEWQGYDLTEFPELVDPEDTIREALRDTIGDGEGIDDAVMQRFINKVKADALRDAGAAVMGERLETETEAGNWLDERADRIEAGEA